MSVTITKNISAAATKDIFELQQKIKAFQEGEIPEDKFKHFRLTRGVYGQRQLGVQMVRLKMPMGRITPPQLVRIAELSEQFASSNLHFTTRQNIQLHYVKVTDAPAIWAGLEDVGVTAREACGNTIRNITASYKAGIDPEEPFDVSPYAYAAFEFFLRNPICQDMGRKIKPAFSSSEKDSAFTFLHDFGFLPKIENNQRGFKVVIAGGLGAQAILAQTAYEFLHEDEIIPFMEACVRVFDRYGERTRRLKARMKFLVKEIGLDAFMQLVEQERKANKVKTFKVDVSKFEEANIPAEIEAPTVEITNEKKYQDWLKTNVFEQKQKGFFAVQLKITNGDVKPDEARKIAEIVNLYASQDMRATMNQALMIKFVRPQYLPYIFTELDKMNFANPGFETIADITTCPGTDTCNLGVTNSMTLAKILEKVIYDEYYDFIFENTINIKMSGCMNSCGQHMAAEIGLHGSSIKVGDKVAPSMQICLGGGVDKNGVGTVGDKIVKLPTKKMPDALRALLNDFSEHKIDDEFFNEYYQRQGKNYFYILLKPLADTTNLPDDFLMDYGQEEYFVPEIGVGECAGVSYDMVGAIIKDVQTKQIDAMDALKNGLFAEAIYYAYTGNVVAAKALLLSKDIACNTQIKILKDFDINFVATNDFNFETTFEEQVLQLNQYEPEQQFAELYVNNFNNFITKVIEYRNATSEDKLVVESSYKA